MTGPAPSALSFVPAFSDSVPAAALEVVLLARDQEAVVADLVAAVVGHLDAHMELPWILTVADHASCDHTFSVACASAATTNERKASARPARQLRNDGDGIFGGGGAQSILAAAKNGSGYAASLVMAVKPT